MIGRRFPLRLLLAVLAVTPALARAADKSSSRPSVISVPKGPGSIAGLGESFTPNLNTGSARESIPLEMPPGTAGLAPSLALTYDSGQGNGPMGLGWSLGLSTIQLQTEKGLPRYDGSDVLLLDGAELVAVEPGIYRLKNEGRFVRVRWNVDHFEVDAPDGTLLRYGLTPEARVDGVVAGAPVVFAWALERVIDRFGNQIAYVYGKDQGQLYLEEVQYNVRPGAAQSRVVLEYEPRPDPLVDYRARFAVRTAQRLLRVTTYALGALRKRYQLAYDEANGVSLLSSVAAFGSDGATALPPVRFWYSRLDGAGAPVSMASVPGAVPGPGDGDDELVDVDGDGFPDLLHAESGVHWYALNQGGAAFGPRQDMPWSPSAALSARGVEVADFDGDGLADLVAKLGLTTPEWHVFVNGGRGRWERDEVLANNPPFGPEDPNARVIDLDHDKLSDLVRTTADGFEAWRNRGDGSWEGPFLSPPPPAGEGLRFEDPHLRLADVNGDRLVDLVYVLDGSVTYWPSMGWGAFGEPIEIANSPAPGIQAEAELQLADANGDGLTDLVWVSVDHVDVWPLLPGDAYGPPVRIDGTPYRDPAATVVRLADMNGNGSTDIVWSTPGGRPDEKLVYVDLVGEVRPNLLVEVENGLGKRLRLTYASSGALFQAAREAGTPWTTRVPFSVQVLASALLLDGMGSSYLTEFTYRDGWYAPDTREYRGFAWAEQRAIGEADDPTLREIHEFDLGGTDEVLKGRERALELRGVDGTLFSRMERTWVPRRYAMGIDGRAVDGAELREQRTYVYEGRPSAVELREAFWYDAWGNATRDEAYGRVVAGDPLAGDDERFTIRTWINDPDRWLIGLLAEEEVQGASGARVSARRLYYDGVAFQGLPLGVASSGALTREEQWVSADHWVQASRVQRDAYGQATALLSPRGTRREVDYDAQTHTVPIAERILLTGRTLAFGATYVPGTPLVTSFTDSNGTTTRFGYDALDRLVTIAKPGDTPDLPTARFGYELGNPVSRLVTEDRVRSGQTPVHRTYAYYDGLGRNVADTIEAEGGRWVISERRRYSRRGAVLAEWDPYFADDPGLPATEPAGAPVRYAYDATGRRTGTTYADGTLVRTVYEPLARELWDGEDLDPTSPHQGTPLRQEDDGLGRTVRTVERLGARALETLFRYDPAGQLREVVNTRGERARWDFDGIGRVVSLDHLDAGLRTFEWDDDGNLIRWWDALVQRVDRAYDGAGRIEREAYVGADGAEQGRITYHYDEPSPRLGAGPAAVGHLTWVEDLAGEEHFRYDARGRMVDDLRVVAGRSYLTSQEFDAQDRVVQLTYPDSDHIALEYNERGFLTRIPGVVSAIEYDARGLPVRRTYANGVDASAEYDLHDRVARILARDGAGKPLQDLGYAYDRAGTLRTLTDAVHATGKLSATSMFAYDDLYRLVQANGPAGAFSYDYDDVGNFVHKGEVGAYAYDPALQPDAVRSVGGRPVDHDANGSVIASLGRTFTYDARGELRTVETADATTEYLYDFEGARTVKRVRTAAGASEVVYVDRFSEVRDGKLVKYVYAGDQRVARLGGDIPRPTAAAGAILRGVAGGGWLLGALLVLAGGLLAAWRPARPRRLAQPAVALGLALVVATLGCGGTHGDAGGPRSIADVYYLTDHLGSASLLVDAAGAPTSEVTYDAWGRQVVGTTEPHTFSGQEWDAEAGLYYFGKRYYDPQLGRFLSVDPAVLDDPGLALADPQVLNPYAYARNTPTSLRDRDGRFAHILVGALVGAAINTGIYLVKGAITGEKYTVRGALAAAASGAVSGAVGAATAGVGLVGSAVASGVAAGAVERGIQTGSVTKALDPRAMAGDALSAVAGVGVAKAIAPLAKAAGGAVRRLGGNTKTVTPPVAPRKSLPVLNEGCFVAGTPVWLADGAAVPIERVRAGDIVTAPPDVATPGDVGAYAVARVHARVVDQVLDVTVVDPAGRRELLTVTLDHPFARTHDATTTWVPAAELARGDVVPSRTGAVFVDRIDLRAERTEVYNLEVERAHAYFVGWERALVHNGGCGKLSTAAATATREHHAWPKYLGGAVKQDLVQLSKSLHDAYHAGLDKVLPRQWSKAYYDALSPAARQQVLSDLASYTKDFDTKYGTQLFKAMVDNGFPGK